MLWASGILSHAFLVKVSSHFWEWIFTDFWVKNRKVPTGFINITFWLAQVCFENDWKWNLKSIQCHSFWLEIQYEDNLKTECSDNVWSLLVPLFSCICIGPKSRGGGQGKERKRNKTRRSDVICISNLFSWSANWPCERLQKIVVLALRF